MKNLPPGMMVEKYAKDFIEAGWWEGFSEKDKSREPTITEKQQMLRYPIISSVIQLTYLPFLSTKISLKGDELQKQQVSLWLSKRYSQIMRMVCGKAIPWGMCVGEKVYDSMMIDNKNYWMLRGLFAPPPYDCKLIFNDDPYNIAGFEFDNMKIERYAKNGKTENVPGMAYYTFRGDEVSLPYGDSLLNDMFWPWQLVMKEWTTASVYDRLHAPVWLLYYMKELVTGSDGKVTDVGRSTAKTLIEGLKNTSGLTIPKHINEKGEIVKGYEFEEVSAQDREPKFMERIKTLNTMIYISALMPERVIEQFKETGSEAMLREQKGFYEQNVVIPRLEEHEEQVVNWFINPMLEINFGKVNLEVDMKLQDRTIEFYGMVLTEMIRQGYIPNVDLQKMAEQVGLPVNPLNPVPEIIEAKRTQIQGMSFQARPSMKQIREKVGKIARPWVEKINNKLDSIKKDIYDSISISLKQIQGSMGLKVMNLKDPILKTDDLASLVQIPRNIFTPIGDGLDKSFMLGMETIIKGHGEMINDIPSDAIKELRLIQKKFEGIGGNNVIGGQPELLEERLFFAIMNALPIDNRVNAFNQAFDNYIGLTLVDNVANELNIALNMGIRYGVKELQRQKLIEQKEGA